MKKTLLLLTAGFLSGATFAQNGFYLAPSVGAGLGNVHQDFYNPSGTGTKKRESIFTYNLGINAGYKRGHWHIEAGAQYGTSGFGYGKLTFGSSFPDTLFQGTAETRYKHIAIPIKIGYELRLANRLKVIPYLGLTASYNLGASTTTNITGEGEHTYPWTKEAYDYGNRRISLWGNAVCRVEYTCTKTLSLFAGPSAQYMISNLIKVPEEYKSTPSIYNASQRNYSIHLDIGAIINL